MAEHEPASELHVHDWASAEKFDDFALVCCGQPHLTLRSDPETFALTQRIGRVGPVTLDEMIIGSDISIDGSDACGSYRILLVQCGRAESVSRDGSLTVGAGGAVLYAPDGLEGVRWTAGSKFLSVKIGHRAVDDALVDALGLHTKSPIDFNPVMSMDSAPTRSWISMVMLFRELMFRSDSLLHQPLVRSPFTDALIRGLLLAADHPYRDAVAKDQPLAAPRTVRLAAEMIEAEAHLPLTASHIAARCHVSVRTLQDSFRRHMGISPMAYLRQVRLRRAHDELLKSDPSVTSVAAVAYRWGFTNLGRFAAAHSARYDECPAATLKRAG
ncbi:hypothetical protein CQY20_10515 [Mycolicibacterium agri]|uniref:HTH araC/xylS-type domain-containing protein n=1 Tax=Mycolicibacterium agri TaxID=36811 RepID=A0A2A7N6G3_MYCAG|nr:helix-turn-helix transcriptional regulator [Mycolicibacterium agri]PEG39317.1 hypothetical protein CQY20_10515 [Mycolicibacterium agri]GFG51694.1 hypothetical protein MAGR_31350 [Mycolicibacterium agri]